MKIGFFDSGLGGLTILQAVVKELPEYDYEFYGDTKNVPYGDKTEEEVYQLTAVGVRRLFDVGCALVIIACNTASAETTQRLQTELLPNEYPNRKILRVIIPTIEALSSLRPTKVALIGTKQRTIESKKYQFELNSSWNDHIVLTQIATPELVPLIELAKLGAASEQAIKRIELEAGECEVVVLECTHYTQIKESLREHFKDEKIIISQDEVIPEKLKLYLVNHLEIVGQLTKSGGRNIYLTQNRPD